MTDEHLLSKREASQRLGCSLRTLDRMTAGVNFPVVQVGRRVLLRESTVNEWIRSHEQRKEAC